MENRIVITDGLIFPQENSFEIVEIKGLGHPDTLADNLAEELSCNYSLYTKKKYGAILHHNFDKVALLGGHSFVKFGRGYLVSPIKVLINGRLSISFGSEKIQFRKLITFWTKKFFLKTLPLIDLDEDLDIILNISYQSSPGRVYEGRMKKSSRHFWFTPRNLNDLPEIANKFIPSNDTSLGVGFFPFSRLEELVIELEMLLNSSKMHKKYPWLGYDIKIMGVRIVDFFRFTICIPQIANYVKNIREYKTNLSLMKDFITKFLRDRKIKFEFDINTRDNYELREIYLTAIGSSIESGDEGLAGRGNRVNGIITPCRPMSMEGSFGKNPVYHIGKVYYVYAFLLSKMIYKQFNLINEVFLVSQSGRDIKSPWICAIRVKDSIPNNKKKKLIKFINNNLLNINQITNSLVSKKLLIKKFFDK